MEHALNIPDLVAQRLVVPLAAEHEGELRPLVADFVRRADPDGRDGYTTEDVLRAFASCPTWLVNDPLLGILGFVSLAVGAGLRGVPEAQYVGLYVAPEHTGEGIAESLVRTAEAWARENGIRRLIFGTQIPKVGRVRCFSDYDKVADLYAKEL